MTSLAPTMKTTVLALVGIVGSISMAYRYAPSLQRLNAADVIIVLGHPAKEDGSPTQAIKEEVEVAKELYESGIGRAIIFTGGAVRNNQVEASIMAQLAIAQGVPENHIYIEPNARDTIENIKNSKQLMQKKGWNSAILVTTPHHIRRACWLLRRYGVKHQYAYFQDSYELRNLWSRFGAMSYDLVGYIWDALSTMLALQPFWSKR
jgi:uncharacterized SAM-binding protein YcdF (DUF218 family)